MSLKRILKLLTSRLVIVALLILIQAAVLVLGVYYLNTFKIVNTILMVLSWGAVLYIISKPDNPMYKLAWIIPILVVPILGGLFYLIFGKRKMRPSVKCYLSETVKRAQGVVAAVDKNIAIKLRDEDESAYKMSKYIQNKAMAPIFQNTYSKFLSPGEKKWEYMLDELKKAKRYIFMEYFIIEDGIMWQGVLDILKQKVIEGVIVKLMYDDLGSVTTLSSKFPKDMAKFGIETRMFNPFVPSLDVFMNHRDHRKILVIDGNVGFTGGINIADEYINVTVKHGHWKDSSVVLKGDAVWNLTVLFLQLWEDRDKEPAFDFEKFKPDVHYETDGYVQPFGDSPLDEDLVGEMTYMNIINSARKYVYITTPYLILDNEMTIALCTAAQSGIDVRIVTPYIADKWFVHAVTRANYPRLVRAGVKVFEYEPGFVHAKTIVCDDKYAIVGTTNFDFRSFYLHFECGVFFYKTNSVHEVYADYTEMLKVCTEITLQKCQNVNGITKLVRAVLSVFAPLM